MAAEHKDMIVRKKAERHVDWQLKMFCNIVRPVAIENFIHGYKHGLKDRSDKDGKHKRTSR